MSKRVYAEDFSGAENKFTEIIFIDAPGSSTDLPWTSWKEVEVITEYCKHLEEEYAVLAPYRKQIELLKKEFKGNKINPENIMTIHGSQGKEYDTVILSVTDSKNPFMMAVTIPQIKAINTINTALSRAKKKLIIVCDYKCWIRKDGELLKHILEVAEPLVKG